MRISRIASLLPLGFLFLVAACTEPLHEAGESGRTDATQAGKPAPADPRPGPDQGKPAPQDGSGATPAVGSATGQGGNRTTPAPAGPEDPKAKAIRLLDEYLAKNGVTLDRKRKVVAVGGQICITNANLEYLAVSRRGKDHESLLLCDCKPSALNAALIAMGLKKGTNYLQKERIPRPSEEDVRSGKVKPYTLVHPKGPSVILTVEWTDKKGKKVRHRAEELVWDLAKEKPLDPRRWVYLGSRMAALYKNTEPVFMADVEFNLVSVCYFWSGNHLLTINHPNGMSQSNWWPNTKLLPPKGTPVRLYFSLQPLD